MKERGCAASIHVMRGRQAPPPPLPKLVRVPVEPKYIYTYIRIGNTYVCVWVCVLCMLYLSVFILLAKQTTSKQ